MKFAVLKFKHILHISPWRFWLFSNEVPGWDSEQGEGRARRFPARSSPGGEGKVGEENKEAEANL